MNPAHLRDYIIIPALKFLGTKYDTVVSRALVLGTAMVESDLHYLHQVGGPAIGLWQMEPSTHDDHWDNFIKFDPELRRRVGMCTKTYHADEMHWNLRYACAMCRVHYWRVPQMLPAENPRHLSHYHKVHYNSRLGKADPEKNVRTFEMALEYCR